MFILFNNEFINLRYVHSVKSTPVYQDVFAKEEIILRYVIHFYMGRGKILSEFFTVQEKDKWTKRCCEIAKLLVTVR